MDIVLSLFMIFLVVSLLWKLFKLLIGFTLSVLTGIAFFTFIGVLLLLFR